MPLGVGFVAALGLTPLARRVALRMDDVDHPVGDKIHKRSTPLMGGIAVYLAFAVASVVSLPPSGPLTGILIGGLAAVVLGLIDELTTLRPLAHGAGQILVALIAVVSGVGVIHSISNPMGGFNNPGIELPLWLGIAITLFWLVGMMNTLNFLDGLDGLATGISAEAALLLAIWGTEAANRFHIPVSAHPEYVYLPLALGGALLGFLPFNWHVARIFLGDTGSMFLGLALASLAIIGPAKLGTALLILTIPVLDVAWAIVRRQMRGRSFLSGDKQHVYHRMMELGLGHTTTVVLLYLLCAILGGLDLYLTKLAKLLAFVVLALLTGAVLVSLEVRATARR